MSSGSSSPAPAAPVAPMLTRLDASRLAALGRGLLRQVGDVSDWHGSLETPEGVIEVEGLYWQRAGSECAIHLPISGVRDRFGREMVVGFLALLVYAKPDTSGRLQHLPAALLAYLTAYVAVSQPPTEGWTPRVCDRAGRYVRLGRATTRKLLALAGVRDKTMAIEANRLAKAWISWSGWDTRCELGRAARRFG